MGPCTFLALFRIPFAANGEVPSHVFKQEEELEPRGAALSPTQEVALDNV